MSRRSIDREFLRDSRNRKKKKTKILLNFVFNFLILLSIIGQAKYNYKSLSNIKKSYSKIVQINCINQY